MLLDVANVSIKLNFLHTASNLQVLIVLKGENTFLFYLQWKDNVLDSFKVTSRNESLFEICEVDTINVWFFCSYKKLVSFPSKRDRSDTTLQLEFPLRRSKKVKAIVLTNNYLLTIWSIIEDTKQACDLGHDFKEVTPWERQELQYWVLMVSKRRSEHRWQ